MDKKIILGITLSIVVIIFIFMYSSSSDTSSPPPYDTPPFGTPSFGTPSLGTHPSMTHSSVTHLVTPPFVPALQPPVACQLSDWGNWTGCGCLTNTQSRVRSIIQEAENGGTPCSNSPLTDEKSCTPTPGSCSEWQRFTNTFISDGEYMSRTHVATESDCYKTCENNPKCAGVYLYNGPETDIFGPNGKNECSLVSANNLNRLYQRHGTMANYNPDNHVAYINKSRAGSAFETPSWASMLA